MRSVAKLHIALAPTTKHILSHSVQHIAVLSCDIFS